MALKYLDYLLSHLLCLLLNTFVIFSLSHPRTLFLSHLHTISHSHPPYALLLPYTLTPTPHTLILTLLTHSLSLSPPPQVRVTQGKEPQHFLELFKGKTIIHKGGKASSFNNTKESDRLPHFTDKF
jgi:hypothetical protein